MMTRATRFGQATFDTMSAPVRLGRPPSSNEKRGFHKRVPAWYVGDVAEFMAFLDAIENGLVPRPTLAEMARYDALLLAANPDEVGSGTGVK